MKPHEETCSHVGRMPDLPCPEPACGRISGTTLFVPRVGGADRRYARLWVRDMRLAAGGYWRWDGPLP
jgi:hypothetical protein